MIKPQRFGRYLLLDRLSTGGMAEVFLAKSSGLQGFEKVVAIKRILPSVSEDSDFTTMFVDEARISANLNHVNIAQIFEFGKVDAQYYIAMEYIPGKDLRAIQAHLGDTGRVMEVPIALHIAARLCQAIDYAHRQKSSQGESMEIIHRDVSPPNVIAAYEGAVKLIDFGIAKAASRATRTRAGKLKGKFAYMSPEQVQGLPLDHRSDIFSLGTVIHELLTGRRLFQGENQIGTLNLVRRAEVPAPSTINPEVPLEVDRIVLKALCRNRDERYAWASELRADIERYLARSGVVFESNHLAEWMRGEFAGEIEAERRMRERIHSLKLEEIDADELTAAPPAPRAGSADTSARTEGAAAAPEAPLHGAEPASSIEAEREELDESPPPEREELDESPPPEREEREELEELEELEGEPTVAVTSLVDELRQETGGLRPSGELGTDGLPALEGDEEQPVVYGPSQSKEHDSIAHLATMLQGTGERPLDPHTAEQLGFADANLGPDDPDQIKVPFRRGRGGAIVPGPDRAATTVGGALEVDSNPDRPLPPTRGERAVDVERGMGAVFDLTGPAPIGPAEVHGAGHSGTRQIQAGRANSVQVMAIAGGATLLLAGVVILVALLLSRESGSVETGSIVVTSQPPASCSVSLGATPKGILEPGLSLTLPSIPAGSHLVSVECAGFHAYATTVDVKASQAAFVVAPLERK